MAGKHDKNIKITVSDNGTLKQKTKDINKLNKAVDRNSKKSGNLDRNMKGNARMSSNASKNFSKQAQGMQGVLVPAYAEVAARVFALTALYTALERAADFAILQKGQAAFAASTGKNMAQIARSVQKASGYMLDFQQASTSTALATTAGLTAKQIEKMTKGARAASVALGRNMADAMDRLTRGIVKAEPEILDELGVIIRLDTVYKDFAKSIDKTTTELTEMEKLTARNVAIMGQLEGKFGDIATTIPANAFAQLSTSIIDMVNQGGALIDKVFGPLVRSLADNKELLLAIMAIVGRSLIRTVFPVFDKMGEKIDAWTTKMSLFRDKLIRTQQSMKKAAKMAKWDLVKGMRIDRATDALTKMGADSGKFGGKKFAEEWRKGTRGKALFDQKGLIKALRQTVRMGMGSAVGTGYATTPGMDGKSVAEMQKLDATLARLQGTLAGIAKATKGTMASDIIQNISSMTKRFASMGIGIADVTGNFLAMGRAGSSLAHELGLFKTVGAIFNKTFRKGLIKTMTKEMKASEGAAKKHLQGTIDHLESLSQEAKMTEDGTKKSMSGITKVFGTMGAAVGATITGLSKGLNALVGIMGAWMMVKWIAQMAFNMSDAFEAASEALSGLTNTLKESMLTTEKYFKSGGRLGNLGSDIAGSIRSREFKANIAEGINEALIGASASLNSERIADAWGGQIMDSIAHVFGQGIADALGGATISALAGLASTMSSSEFEKFIEDINLQGNLQKNINTGGGWEATGAATAGLAALGVGLHTVTVGSAALEVAYATWAAAAAASVPVIGWAAAGLTAIGVAGWLAIDAFKKLGTSSKEASDDIVGTLRSVNEGIISSAVAIDKMEESMHFESRAGAIQFFEDLSAATKSYNKIAKKQAETLKNLANQFKKVSEGVKSISDSLLLGGNLKDFAGSFGAVIKGLDNVVVTQAEKYKLLKQEGWEFTGDHADMLKSQLKLEEKHFKALADIRARSDVRGDEKKDLVAAGVKTLTATRAYIEELQGAIYSKIYSSTYGEVNRQEKKDLGSLTKAEQDLLRAKTDRAIAVKLFGGDAQKLYHLELAAAVKLAQYATDKVHMEQFGNSALKEKATIELKILGIEKQRLLNKLVFATQSKEEARNTQLQIENLNVKILQAGKIARKLSEHFHDIAGTTQTITQRISAMSRDNTFKAGEFLQWKSDEINKEFNAFRHSLDETFASGQQVVGIISTIIEKNGELSSKGLTEAFAKRFAKAFPSEKEFKKTYKWIKLATTAEGKVITSRFEQLNKEKIDRDIEVTHWAQHEDLIELRKTIATYERDMREEGLELVKKEIMLREIAAETEKTQAELIAARRDEWTSDFREAFEKIGSSFESGISGAVSDLLMDKEVDGADLHAELTQGLADAAGDMIGGMANDLVFSRSGLLGSITEGLFGSGIADKIFPPTDVEKLVQKLEDLGKFSQVMVAHLKDIKVNTKALSDTIKSGKTQVKTTESDTGVQKLSKAMADAVGGIGKTIADKFSSTIKDSLGHVVTQGELDLATKTFVTESELTSALDAYNKKVQETKDKKKTYKDLTSNSLSASLGTGTGGTGIPALDKILNNIDIVQKGKELETFPNMNKTNYSFQGFESEEAGRAELNKNIKEHLRIAKDSIFALNADYFLQLAGQYSYFKKGTTDRGANLSGVRSSAGQGLFAKGDKGGLGAIIHEAVHPLVQSLNSLIDIESFDRYSDVTQTSMLNQSQAYLGSAEFKGLDTETAQHVYQFLNAITAKSKKVIEEYLVRGISQNALRGEGSKPSDWVPSFIQEAMPEVVKEMDRLSTPDTLKEFNSSVVDAIGSLGEFFNKLADFQSWNSQGFWQGFGGGTGSGPFRVPTSKSTFARDRKNQPGSKDPYDMAANSGIIPFNARSNSLLVQKFRIQQLEVKALQERIYRIEKLNSNNFKNSTASDLRASALKGGTPEQLARWAELQDIKERQQRLAKLHGEPGTFKRKMMGDMRFQTKAQYPLKAKAFMAGEALVGLLKKYKVAAGVITGIIALLTKGWNNVQEAKKSDMYKEQDKEYQAYKSSVEYYDPYSNLQTNSLTTSNLTKDATKDVGDSLIFGSATKDIDSIATSGLNFTAQLIDTQRLQIQEFMSVLAASEMGTPLKDAVTSLEAFMSFISNKMSPMVTDLTALIQATNSLFGIVPTLPTFNNSTENTLEPHVSATGAMLVEEVNPVVVGSGQPVQVTSTGTENAMTAAGNQIKSSLSSGFANLIMNNNSNARAMITNTLSQVGTNLMTEAIGSLFKFANGGVLSGGFKAFANGGTVSQPTLGLVGEGKYNEAVVPLPDGRSIPVTGATGSTENNITVNVTIDSDGNAKSDTNSGMDGDTAKQLGYMVSQAVQMELVDQKRPGGLLSQY
jgi:hypothetical protein